MALSATTLIMTAGVNYTATTDSSVDWSAVTNNTYFYDKTTKLTYYKTSGGVVVSAYDTFTGGTVDGLTATTISATTISATTLIVNGVNITGDTTTLTGVTSVGEGLTIFDSIVDRNLQINSITGDGLEKITTSLSANTIEVGINEQNLTLWDLVVQGNRLLSGNVSYISGLTFSVSPLEYLINGTIYDITSATTVTLNSGDSTYDRIDVIFADISGNTGVLEGTPSENPEKPIVDGETQVEVTFVLVPANSTTANINEFIIYNENLGPPTEWTFGAVGLQPTRISGSSTDQAYSGNTSIRVSGVTGSFTTSFRLTGSTILNTNQYATLQFAIRNLSENTTTSQIRLRFLSTGGTQNGNAVFMNAAGSSGFVQYSSNNTSSWQLISIPLWRFYLTNTNVQVVEFSFSSPNARYYFDLIEFVEGLASSPPSNSWTTIKGDGATTITATNPNATLTILGGTNIGSFITGTSTVVLNLDNNISLSGVSASTISATTYQNLPVSGLTAGNNVNISGSNGNFTISVTGVTQGLSGDYLPLSGGTVSGTTQFTNGLTATTISATTYQNLPSDVNIYNSNGALTGNRLVNLSGNSLTFSSVTSGITVIGLYGSGNTSNSRTYFEMGQKNGGGFSSSVFLTSFAPNYSASTWGSFYSGSSMLSSYHETPGVTGGFGNLYFDITHFNSTVANRYFAWHAAPATTARGLSTEMMRLHILGNGDGNLGINTKGVPSEKLHVSGNTLIQGSLSARTAVFSSSSQNILTVVGSGNSTTSPIFNVQGSSGELFSVSDSLTGSLFSVNDISGLPIVEVFSDNTTLMGSYLAPSLNTTTRISLSAGTNTIYSIPTSAYTGAFYEYTLISTGTTGARAGQIMSIWSGTTANFTETTTTDIGSTTGVTFTVAVSGNNAVLSSSATTAGWTVKTIIRSI